MGVFQTWILSDIRSFFNISPLLASLLGLTRLPNLALELYTSRCSASAGILYQFDILYEVLY